MRERSRSRILRRISLRPLDVRPRLLYRGRVQRALGRRLSQRAAFGSREGGSDPVALRARRLSAASFDGAEGCVSAFDQLRTVRDAPCRLRPRGAAVFARPAYDLFGTGIEAVSAMDCYEGGEDYGYEYPGFAGMDLGDGVGHWKRPDDDPYIFHFSDGNASIARMLVRSLVPSAIPGSTMGDIVLAPCDYAVLDGQSRAPWRSVDGERRRGNVRSRRQSLARDRVARRACELARRFENHRAGTARSAKTQSCLLRERTIRVHARRVAEWRAFHQLGV
jgi:hypothetical protein